MLNMKFISKKLYYKIYDILKFFLLDYANDSMEINIQKEKLHAKH